MDGNLCVWLRLIRFCVVAVRARLFVFAAVAEGDCYDILFVSRCRNPRLYFSLKEPLSAIGANLALRKDLILNTAVRRTDQGVGTCRYTVNEKRSTNTRRHGPSMPWTGASDPTSALGWRSAASLRNTTTRWTKRSQIALYFVLCSYGCWHPIMEKCTWTWCMGAFERDLGIPVTECLIWMTNVFLEHKS